jgi:hypothetical protein
LRGFNRGKIDLGWAAWPGLDGGRLNDANVTRRGGMVSGVVTIGVGKGFWRRCLKRLGGFYRFAAK